MTQQIIRSNKKPFVPELLGQERLFVGLIPSNVDEPASTQVGND
jgi:hypothetical protein